MTTLLKILWLLLIVGSIWFVDGPTAIIFWLPENLDQTIQLLVWAALTSVGVFALVLAWAFISLRTRNIKADWSWNKKDH